MELLEFIFRLGVVFAIYGFLWGLIEFGIRLLSIGRVRSIGEVYILKGVKYIFLSDVTLLFCIQEKGGGLMIGNQIILAGIILLMYFIGKFQNSQNQFAIFQVMMQGNLQKENSFNLRAEIIVIVMAMVAFIALYFFPEKALNPISSWFHDSILNIEDTPVFGFIFKIIGFFFLVSMIMKLVNAFTYILSGGRINPQVPPRRNNHEDNNNDYDDFEEIS